MSVMGFGVDFWPLKRTTPVRLAALGASMPPTFWGRGLGGASSARTENDKIRRIASAGYVFIQILARGQVTILLAEASPTLGKSCNYFLSSGAVLAPCGTLS